MRRSFIPALLVILPGMVIGFLLIFGERFQPVRDAVHSSVDKVRGNSMKVEVGVLAKQFSWHFQYPGKDGVLARTSVSSITKQNPMGIDYLDPAAADDLVLQELVLPCGADVRFQIDSEDVIHALGDLEGDFNADAIPGVTTSASLKTSWKPRSGQLRCVQLCGSGHADHHAPYRLLEKEDYIKWQSGHGKVSP